MTKIVVKAQCTNCAASLLAASRTAGDATLLYRGEEESGLVSAYRQE